MNGYNMVLFLLLSCMVGPSAFADIYEWTDEDGVKHYSNYAPPHKSRVVLKSREEPYDAAADQVRMEAEAKERLELARLELDQREAELELREAEAERRLAQAERVAQEALQEAEYPREVSGTGSRVIYRGRGYAGPGNRWDDYDTKYNRRHYRKKHSRRHYSKLYHLSPYQRYLYVKKHYGPDNTKYRYKYRHKSRLRHNGYYSEDKFKSTRGRKRGTARIGSGDPKFKARRNFSRGRFGFGRRP